MRSAKDSQRVTVAAILGIAGVVMILVSLPSWLLMTLAGVGLVAGAYFVYQNGL